MKSILSWAGALVAVLALSGAALAAPARHSAFPDLVAVDVYGNLKNRGFHCSGPAVTGKRASWTCTRNYGIADFSVIIAGNGPFRITWVQATALVYSGDPTTTSRSFLAFVASIPYGNARPAQAQAWVNANTGRHARTRFGSATYELRAFARARVLEISA